MIHNWQVDKRTLFSDHRLIKHSWNFNQGDPLKIQRGMEDVGGISPVWSKMVINMVDKSIKNDLTESLNRNYPMTMWWNKELESEEG